MVQFLLIIPLSLGPAGIVLVVLDFVGNGLGDEGLSLNIISLLRNSDVDLVGDHFNPRTLELLLNSMGEKSITGSVSNIHDTFFGVSRGFNNGDALVCNDSVDIRSVLLRKVGKSDDVDLVNDEDGGLVLEKGLDRVEELALQNNQYMAYERKQAYLSLNSVTTLFGKVHEVKDSTSQVGKSSDGLHFNGVHLLERMVKDTRGVNDLPSEVLVIHVTDKQGFCSESVLCQDCQQEAFPQIMGKIYGLDIYIGPGDLVNETGLSNVGIAADQESPGVGIDSRQSRNVLPDLLQVRQGVLLPPHDSRHPTQSGLLQLLTSVEGVTKLEETDVILRNLRDEVSSGVDLTQGELVVVLVVKDVEKRREERVKVVEDGELGNYFAKLLIKGVLSELDLSHVDCNVVSLAQKL